MRKVRIGGHQGEHHRVRRPHLRVRRPRTTPPRGWRGRPRGGGGGGGIQQCARALAGGARGLRSARSIEMARGAYGVSPPLNHSLLGLTVTRARSSSRRAYVQSVREDRSAFNHSELREGTAAATNPRECRGRGRGRGAPKDEARASRHDQLGASSSSSVCAPSPCPSRDVTVAGRRAWTIAALCYDAERCGGRAERCDGGGPPRVDDRGSLLRRSEVTGRAERCDGGGPPRVDGISPRRRYDARKPRVTVARAAAAAVSLRGLSRGQRRAARDR